uniref:BZIP domain-containing protein n=1 Tax=Angiostrongylus cantonensis TaxID=6313 RepID=A0A158P6U2_ANGCA
MSDPLTFDDTDARHSLSLHMEPLNVQPQSIDAGETGKFNRTENNNNESAQPQVVSSSRSDSDSTASPNAPRHNVIVKNHSKRKKEDDLACRAATLEQENIKLRAELEQLKNETGHLRALVLAPVKATEVTVNKIGVTVRKESYTGVLHNETLAAAEYCGSNRRYSYEEKMKPYYTSKHRTKERCTCCIPAYS